MATPPLTKDEFKADICRILQTDVSDVSDADNLIDHGLDSIRLMALVQQWNERGVPVVFEDLAAYPEVNHWWQLVEARHHG